MPELDIRGILAELSRKEVEFLLSGGVAVGFHGYVRATKDVDVVPAPDPANLAKLAEVLRELGAEVEGAEDSSENEPPDPLDPETLSLGGNWVLRTRLGRLDIMQSIDDNALWTKLSPAAVEAVVGDLTIKVASYGDLVALKQEDGRPEDLLDLKRLREARGEPSLGR